MAVDGEALVAAARRAGLRLAVAESLTGGLVAAAITSVPGASDVFVGGVVAYDASVKSSILGVDRDLIEVHGVVSAEVAIAMAEGVARRLGADLAVGTTGVAGPAAHGGREPGEVVVAAIGVGEPVILELTLAGDRADVREGATRAAIDALVMIITRRDGPGEQG